MVPVFEIVPKKMDEMIHSKTWFIHIGNMYEAKNE
jgi:hypothetical protein